MAIKKLIKNFFGSQLRINMLSGIVTMFLNIMILAVSYPLYLHYLGYEKYGVWLLLATVFNFAQLGMLGIKQAVTKLVAQEYGRNDLVALQSFVTMALTTLTVTGLVVLVGVLAFDDLILKLLKLTGDNTQVVKSLLPYVGLLSVYVFYVQAYSAILAGLGRMDLTNYIFIAGRVATAGISLILLALGKGIVAMLWGQAACFILIHLLSFFFTRKLITIHIFRLGNFNRKRFLELLSFCGNIFGGSLVAMLIDPFNKIMLSRYAGVESVPVYDICFRSAYQVRSLFEAALRAMMPEISRLSTHESNDSNQRIEGINRRALRIIGVGAGPLFLILIIFAPILLKLWLRNSFVPELTSSFRIMLLAIYSSLLSVPSYYTLMGMGKPHLCFFSLGILAVINVGLAVFILFMIPPLTVEKISIDILLAMAGSTLFLFISKHNLMKRYYVPYMN